jgi:AcrR family transcriptional regulator
MTFEKLETDKQKMIINAACETFARHGYKKASMKDIASTAGVSKSVLFKYFTNKQNLYQYIFRISSDSIRAADDVARLEGRDDPDLFSLMRRSAKTRLALFTEYPWIYKFSYTAAFDPDPFVRDLVVKELEDYRKTQSEKNSEQGAVNDYRGIRKDIPLAAVKQAIFWISQGYLEEKLNSRHIDPVELEKGYEQWIDVLETLFKEK